VAAARPVDAPHSLIASRSTPPSNAGYKKPRTAAKTLALPQILSLLSILSLKPKHLARIHHRAGTRGHPELHGVIQEERVSL
jgi:hypothetical protein